MDKIQVTSVACNHCGAPLQIAASTRFVTCAYCNHQLEVHRSGTSVYTEVLASIDQRTQQIAQDLNIIKQQNELETIDREWQMQREQFMHRDKHGNMGIPTAAGSIIGAVVAVVFGIVWVGMASSFGAPAFFSIIGVIVILGAIVSGLLGASKALRYQHAEREYQQRRSRAASRKDRPEF